MIHKRTSDTDMMHLEYIKLHQSDITSKVVKDKDKEIKIVFGCLSLIIILYYLIDYISSWDKLNELISHYTSIHETKLINNSYKYLKLFVMVYIYNNYTLFGVYFYLFMDSIGSVFEIYMISNSNLISFLFSFVIMNKIIDFKMIMSVMILVIFTVFDFIANGIEMRIFYFGVGFSLLLRYVIYNVMKVKFNSIRQFFVFTSNMSCVNILIASVLSIFIILYLFQDEIGILDKLDSILIMNGIIFAELIKFNFTFMKNYYLYSKYNLSKLKSEISFKFNRTSKILTFFRIVIMLSLFYSFELFIKNKYENVYVLIIASFSEGFIIFLITEKIYFRLDLINKNALNHLNESSLSYLDIQATQDNNVLLLDSSSEGN